MKWLAGPGLALSALLCACATPPVAPSPTAAPVVPAPGAAVPAIFAFEGVMTQGGAVIGTAPVGTVDLRLGTTPVPVDANRRFLIAFDRDAGPSATLVARLADGRTVEHTLAIAPRTWRIERINAPLRPTRDEAAFLALRKPELEQIAAARAVRSDSQGWRQPFAWPRIGRISGLFGAQRIYQGQPGAYHAGIDIAGATGDPVRAPADGVVVLAAATPFTLEGRLLIVDHGAGLNSAFLHLSRIDVTQGQRVTRGQVIGAIGATGRTTGPHLHWALKWHDARIDPLLLAGAMPGPERKLTESPAPPQPRTAVLFQMLLKVCTIVTPGPQDVDRMLLKPLKRRHFARLLQN